MQKTLITIDTNTRGLITSTGERLTQVSDMPLIERGQWQILCFQFYSRTEGDNGAPILTPVNLGANTSFIVVGDNNFSDNDSLMFKSLQNLTPFDENDPASNTINIPGDWLGGETADLSAGQLSVRINTDTVKFGTVMGASDRVISGLYLNVKQYTVGISNPSTLAWIKFVACNTVRDWSTAQVVPPTGTEAISFINTYFRNPLERVFAVTSDGSYTSAQTSEHRWYKERISAIGADWSDPVMILSGAVFTPTVSSASIISWTNDQGLDNPVPVNIRGGQGIQGIPGSSGASSYQVWLAQGNTGTISDYMAAIKGDPGIGIIRRGFWDSGSSYAVDSNGHPDSVTHNGSWWEYYAASPSSGQEPVDGSSYWRLLVSMGDSGGYFTPAVSSEGVLSYTNNFGAPNPASVNVRGPVGESWIGADMSPLAYTDALGECSIISTGVGSIELGVAKTDKVAFEIMGSSGATGDMRLDLAFDSASAAAFTIAVTGTYAEHQITLDSAHSGYMTLSRQSAHGEDTFAGEAGVRLVLWRKA